MTAQPRAVSAALIAGLLSALPAAGAAVAAPPAVALPPGTKTLRDLPYVEHAHARQKLDLYLPG
jgi:uncharacterized membrane protein YagU involved in acid resistance